MTQFAKDWLTRHSWLLLLIGIALLVRFYKINTPLADWHSFRQADTASVTREYLKNGIDLLRPRYHDLSNIQSGQDNLEGYRMVEFPFINAGTALVINATGAPLVLTSRVISILFSLGTLVSLYGFVKVISNQRVAWLSAAFFAVLPYSIFYSRAILPEPGFLFFSMFSLMAFAFWLDKRGWGWWLSSAIALALALLLKPFAVFLAPVYLVLAWRRFGVSLIWQWQLWIYGLMAVAPFWWWREWITQFPSGIPASDWLFNSNGIRFRPAWFRWLFWERIGKLMTGYLGLGLLVMNVCDTKSDRWVYGSWWVGILGYFSVIATGNVQHDYYQVLAVPIICISLGRGIAFLYDWLSSKISRPVASIASGFLTAAILMLAWQQVSGYFNVNHWEYVEAGQAADQVLPADAKVIAPAFGDTHFLFQTNRTGWPIGFEIEDKIKKGATHYVTTSDDDEARRLQELYPMVEKGSRYLILDLRQPK